MQPNNESGDLNTLGLFLFARARLWHNFCQVYRKVKDLLELREIVRATFPGVFAAAP